VELESELFEPEFTRPLVPPLEGQLKARAGRRPFSMEQDSNKSKITGLYNQAQKEAQSAIEAPGIMTAAPFLRKATAESALGAHLKALQTTHDGLTVAPSDPKLLRRFQAGIPWVVQDRFYRNEITRPRPMYGERGAVVEVVVEEMAEKGERALQEMPEEWKRIDIMDLLLEQEKIMKSFDDVRLSVVFFFFWSHLGVLWTHHIWVESGTHLAHRCLRFLLARRRTFMR
jgi:hypothetical protein